MDMSKLSATDRRILYAAIGVIIGGVVGIIDNWGVGGNIGLLGGIVAALVVLQPQLAPTMKLPMAKSLILLGAGVAAAGGFALSILVYLRYALDFTEIYSILFDLGFVAAIVLFWLTWTGYKAEQAAAMPAKPAAEAPEGPPAEPPMA